MRRSIDRPSRRGSAVVCEVAQAFLPVPRAATRLLMNTKNDFPYIISHFSVFIAGIDPGLRVGEQARGKVDNEK